MSGDIVEETVLWEMLRRRASLSPAATMLVDEHGRRLTFAEVATEAEGVAGWLLEVGIGPGTVVSWQLPTRIETLVLSLALARLGAVQNPIIPMYRSREVGAMVRQSGAEWLVTLESFRGFDHAAMARELSREADHQLDILVLPETLPHGDVAALPVQPDDGEQIRWIYTTSGTTSAPKGVCHTDASLIAGGVGLAAALRATSSDVMTILFPYAHIGGPDMLITALTTGVPTVLMDTFDPVAAMPLLRREQATISGGGTGLYSMFLREYRRNPGTIPVPSLRALAGGGSPMPDYLFHEIRAEMGIDVLHGYGMTESPMIAQGGFGDAIEALANTEGRPVLGCEVETRGEDGTVLTGAGQQGEIWVRGPMLFTHYLVDGEVVRPHDANGWFSTGDIGYLRPDGHLVLTGRAKDLIIRNGESISPMEIEDVLAQHPSVQEVAVIGLPDRQRGERICAVLEILPGTGSPEVEELRDLCAASGLSPYKFPEVVEVVPELPRTTTLKVRKQELRERFSAMPEGVS